MPRYRVYYDDADGGTRAADAVDADSDLDAIAKAAAGLGLNQVMEVWENERLVARIAAASVTAKPRPPADPWAEDVFDRFHRGRRRAP